MNPLKHYLALSLLLYIFFFSAIGFGPTKTALAASSRIHIVTNGYPSPPSSLRKPPSASFRTLPAAFLLYFNDWPSDTLEVTCVGYQPFKLALNLSKDSILATISMERGSFNEGARVKVKVNKGLLVWRKIVQHKPENNRYRFDNFSYELYNKLELDLKNLNFSKMSRFKPLRPIGELIKQNIDTSEGLTYLPNLPHRSDL